MFETDKKQLLLGIDIGGTKAVVVLARGSGEVLAESRLDDWASGSWERDLATLVDHARVLFRGAGLSVESTGAVGLSAPGPLDIHTGVVLEAPNLRGWTNVPIVERVAREFRTQVNLENDANAAALAEWCHGAGQGTRNLLYLTMSTGVGAGLILDGQLYRGTSYQAGEVGHLPIVPQGRLCGCGLRGCLEAYTSGTGIAQIIREDLERGERSGILELAGGDPSRISARLWVEALRAGDNYALRLRRSFLDHLAQGLATLIPVFDPEMIVLGTIIQMNPDLFLDDLIERVRERTWPSLHHVRIEPGQLGPRLPAYAALCVASLVPADVPPRPSE